MARLILTLALVLVVGFGSNVSAHSPEGWLGFAFQWPAGLEPTLDGAPPPNEWSVIPEFYWQDTSMMPDTKEGAEMDLSDWSAKAAVSWSEATNRFYLYSEVFDDFSVKADTWQIVVDADHSGGRFQGIEGLETDEDKERWGGAHGQQYEFFNTIGEGTTEQFVWAKADWLRAEGFTVPEYTFEGDANGAGTTFMEIQLTPWDDMNWEGPDASIIHDLVEGDVVGLGYNWMDYEDPEASNGEAWESFWNLTANSQMFWDASAINDFELAPVDDSVNFPTAVEATSWGRIKTRFVE